MALAVCRVEQVSSGGTVTHLHHDQQGSTRLLTGSTGTVTGSTTFDADGNKTGSTGTSTTPSGLTPSWSQVGTRFVGFWDGFTRPLAGGTAALRGALGLNGGLETCSIEYNEASNIGRLDASIEAGAAVGGGGEVLLDDALESLPRLGPVVSPLAAGSAGGLVQHAVAGEAITPATGPTRPTLGRAFKRWLMCLHPVHRPDSMTASLLSCGLAVDQGG